MKNIRNIGEAILLMGIITLGVSACVSDTIIYPEDPEVPDTVTVSFNDQIIPIFDADCNGSGCHDGTWAPDLTPANAYDALISGNYVDTDNPESSSFYVKIAPGGSMEQFISAGDRALILAWIDQGAQNN
ncbi:MAG: hypothetical protein HKN67_09595 [Saprospiraceae bacterium]|nr:hypothetical protein [Saprospiraceae bacterium]